MLVRKATQEKNVNRKCASLLCCRELDEKINIYKINIVSVHSTERLVQEVISQSKHKDCKQDQGQENDIQTSKTIPKNRTYHFTACISVHIAESLLCCSS